MSFTQTEQCLNDIRDEGLFEKLATAVLREAEPAYRSLAHTGVNPEGKTVKSPVDGIAFRSDTVPPHLYSAHHATTSRKGLRKKWLYDPTLVKRRKTGATSTPEGDVLKTAHIIAAERLKSPDLKATLILTTTQEPDPKTILEVFHAGTQANIHIDLWSVSRLAQYLDTKPEGQFLRRHYLGTSPTLLSRSLLLELSVKSLDAHPLHEPLDLYVPRALDELLSTRLRGRVTFLVAPSGFGKSVACRKRLAKHLQAGGAALILGDHHIANALTLPDAIDAALRELCPSLAPGSGSAALALSTPGQPLLLSVEDINESGQARRLAERIESWSRAQEPASDGARGSYHLLCPLWPEVLGSLDERTRGGIESTAVFGSAFSPAEGRQAVQRFAQARGRILSDLAADAISTSLGHDPLLIALHDPSKHASADAVIGNHVEGAITLTLGSHLDHAATDYRQALRAYAGAALAHRSLNPSWAEVKAWQSLSAQDRACLNHLMHDRRVLYLNGPSDQQRVVYRHDRVRDWMLADAADAQIANGTLPADIPGDPFFAEIIGGVAARREGDANLLARLRTDNPLALFHALRLLPPAPSAHRASVVAAIETWLLEEPAAREFSSSCLGWEVLTALARTDGPEVLRLLATISDDAGVAWQARLRNGDLTGGLALCGSVEPGATAPWRDLQIAHAKMVYGHKLVVRLGEVLERRDLTTPVRMGALRLAGHVAEPALAEPIARCWAQDADRLQCLEDYLWAAAECCGTEAERYLAPICDAWAQLPSMHDDAKVSPSRESLAAHQVRWAFRRWVPHSAIAYFVKRAESEELRWPITYMLSEIDDPVAVQFIVHEIALMERRVEGTSSFSPFSHEVPHHWRRHQKDSGVGMSTASRDPLKALWTDPNTEKHLRRAALRLWAATEAEGDAILLQDSLAWPELADELLRVRLRRGDRAALPLLLNKLRSPECAWGWWTELRSVFSDDLVHVLDVELARRCQGVSQPAGRQDDTGYILSELVTRLSPDVGEALLLRYWETLRHRSDFVQAALFLATPVLLDHVRIVIESATDPKQIFEAIGQHTGWNIEGHPGITREPQIIALVPYLPYLDSHEIENLREICNQQGWFMLRRTKLDPFVARSGGILYEDPAVTFASLDEMVKTDRAVWLPHWLDRYAGTGATTDTIVAQMAAWFAQRRSREALEIVRAMLIHVGRRRDLWILDVELEPSDAAADSIRADAAFGVRRRSLH